MAQHSLSRNLLTHLRRLRGTSRISMIDPKTLEEVRGALSILARPNPSPLSSNSIDLAANRIEQMLLDALITYGDELQHLRWWARLRNERDFFPAGGMYDWIEAQVAYLLIRAVRPRVVVEISPNYGYSTGFVLLALNRNGEGELCSFDLEETFFAQARRNFARVGLDYTRQQAHVGDAKQTAPAVLSMPIDILFMDSDHAYAFAQWYIASLYPRVRPGGLIHAHDVLRYGVRPHQGDEGEGRALWEFLEGQHVPDENYFYVSDFVRQQPLKPTPLAGLARYPFGERSLLGSNNVEQCASLWILKEGW